MQLMTPKSLNKRIIAILAIVFIVIAGLIYATNSPNNLSTFDSENEQIFEQMKNSQTKEGIDPSRLQEITKSIKDGNYTIAQSQTNSILKEPNLTENDRKALLTIMASTCIPLKDLSCVDSLLDNFGKELAYDYFLLVEAARLANSTEQSEKAKIYYQKAKAGLDEQGGQKFVDVLNQEGQVTLDYEEIKSGAES